MNTYSDRAYSLPEEVPDILCRFDLNDAKRLWAKAKPLFEANPDLVSAYYSIRGFEFILIEPESYDVTGTPSDDYEADGWREWDFLAEGWRPTHFEVTRGGTINLEFSSKYDGTTFGITLTYRFNLEESDQ